MYDYSFFHMNISQNALDRVDAYNLQVSLCIPD